MDESTLSNNKRIAKNTLLLYVRMILTMGITLFTSRVILQVLGIEDYGIYNLVGGVIAMFGFVSSSLSTATQRFITFELGKGPEANTKSVFSTCLLLHILIALIIATIADVAGTWFIANKLVIPSDRLSAAIWVFQFCILSTIVMIISVPFNAEIVAHERMSAFAMISIVEAVLKLLIVYSLMLTFFDKLIVYGALILLTQISIQLLYYIYCKKHFEEVCFTLRIDKTRIKEIGSFASWSILGNVSYLTYTQGLNLLLGTFFMPAVNAARGIALQVQGAVNTFVANFQTAINPQITKTYAAGQLEEMHSLVFRSSRFSFYLLLIISLPFVLEAEPILRMWLGVVPDYTVVFLRLIFITTWINSFANPLIISVKASGKIWQYESVVAVVMLLILPVSYLFLYLGVDAWVVFAVHLAFECIAQVARISITSKLINFSQVKYVKEVLVKISLTSTVSLIIPVVFYCVLPESWSSFIIVCAASICSTLLSVWTLGLTRNERQFFTIKMKTFIQKIR
ncbi:MAG: lipopolysaccharide biosynthesis protein [Bacteroides sp.]|nr:lipopolysaccharide biosynthesis protein [Bacteroides sp.]MCM1447163.1 lipopolysaccharide biosynthesis protein [Bacteroides sp.]